MINKWRDVYDSKESKNPWKYKPTVPLYLDMEPTNHCNFNCSFCVGKQQMKRQKGFMDFLMFKDICDQASEIGVNGIRLLRWGEPFIHSRILDMIKYAHDKGLLTHVTTNGSGLHRFMSNGEIMESGLDSMIISHQGLTEKEYLLMRGKMYEFVIDNIHSLIERRKKYKNPYIIISTTVTDESEEEIEVFKNKWKNVVDDVSIGYTWWRRLKDKSKVQDLVKRSKKLPHIFKCQEVMIKLSIDWDGSISPCCLDYDQQLTVGNFNDMSLMDAWKSEEVKAIRTLLTNKRQDMFTLCSTCELNYDFRGKK